MSPDAHHRKVDLEFDASHTESIVAGRLAIVDANGVERIVLEVDRDVARLLIRSPDSEVGRSTAVEVAAMASIDGDPSTAIVNLSHEGDIAFE